MARLSPILPLHERAEALLDHYGPADAPDARIPFVQAYDRLDLEYAAIRKAAALIDLPHRATLVVRGSDRLSFLNSMLTQELKGLQPAQARSAFWLNKKGRVDADLRVLIEPDRVIFDVDAHAAARTVETLSAYVITEDVQITDETDRFHRLALHGPAALRTLGLSDLPPNTTTHLSIKGVDILIDRNDTTAEVGLDLLIPIEGALSVYQHLLEKAHEPLNPGRPNPGALLRPVGWAAYNIARIEAGTPLYLTDFGPTNLPAETGLLNERVSFKKGCYLGQEIVARMNALGHPKQTLVALRLTDPHPETFAPASQSTGGSEAYAEPPLARFPFSAAPVFASSDAQSEPIGAITSSTLSPLLSKSPIAFAMVKWGSHTAGTKLYVPVEAAPTSEGQSAFELLEAVVQPTLRTLPAHATN